MGQRLNIQIYQGERLLASAFYQWGAYTKRAMDLTTQIIATHNQMKLSTETDQVLYAIQLLESTGATLAPEELSIAQQRFGNQVVFKEGQSIDKGIIAITPHEMQQMEDADEGRVEIYLDTEDVVFDVCGTYCKETYVEHYLEDEDDAEEVFEQLPLRDMDLARFVFFEVEEMANFVGSLSCEKIDTYRLLDDTVITLVV